MTDAEAYQAGYQEGENVAVSAIRTILNENFSNEIEKEYFKSGFEDGFKEYVQKFEYGVFSEEQNNG